MAQSSYAILSFGISGAKDEALPSDNVFRVTSTQAHYNTLESYSGNQGNNNAFGSGNISIEVYSGTDTGARNRCTQSVIGAGEAGIIRIPERYLVKN